MPIITCPDCGHHPVSDRAPNCPKCGCPIAGVNAAVDAIHPSNESTKQAPSIRKERAAQLAPLDAGLMDSTDFPDSSVFVNDLTKLAEIVSQIQGWCEELYLGGVSAQQNHVDVISRVSNLKSLDLSQAALDDEGLLRVSKLQTLRKLMFFRNERRTSAVGWLQLARLSRLELLRLPITWNLSWDEEMKLKQELRKRLPDPIIQ